MSLSDVICCRAVVIGLIDVRDSIGSFGGINLRESRLIEHPRVILHCESSLLSLLRRIEKRPPLALLHPLAQIWFNNTLGAFLVFFEFFIARDVSVVSD